VGYNNIPAPLAVQGAACLVGAIPMPLASTAETAINQGSTAYLTKKAKAKAISVLNLTTLSNNAYETFTNRLGVLLTTHFGAHLQGLSHSEHGHNQPEELQKIGFRSKLPIVDLFAKEIERIVQNILRANTVPPELLNQQHLTLEYPFLLAEYVFKNVLIAQTKLLW
jgi:hypothetical protein